MCKTEFFTQRRISELVVWESVAQLVGQRASNQKVWGSIPDQEPLASSLNPTHGVLHGTTALRNSQSYRCPSKHSDSDPYH